MKGETEVLVHGVKVMLGTKFYLITEYGRSLCTINYLTDYIFEWNGGWANISELKLNENSKSKVKLIINEI